MKKGYPQELPIKFAYNASILIIACLKICRGDTLLHITTGLFSRSCANTNIRFPSILIQCSKTKETVMKRSNKNQIKSLDKI